MIGSFRGNINNIGSNDRQYPYRGVLDGKKQNGEKQFQVVTFVNSYQCFEAASFIPSEGFKQCFFGSIQVNIFCLCKSFHNNDLEDMTKR